MHLGDKNKMAQPVSRALSSALEAAMGDVPLSEAPTLPLPFGEDALPRVSVEALGLQTGRLYSFTTVPLSCPDTTRDGVHEIPLYFMDLQVPDEPQNDRDYTVVGSRRLVNGRPCENEKEILRLHGQHIAKIA